MRVLAVIAVIGLVSLSAVVAENEYTAIAGGPGTICSKGTKYTYFFRPGSTNADKLAVFFEGGGACWDAISCATPIYSEAVDVAGTLASLNSGDGIVGPDTRSPLAGWNVLYIPYCTADVHTGNNTKDYDGLYTIHHVGRVNVEDALNYASKHVVNPVEVATIGCSAGSLGAFLNAPFVMQRWPDASRHYVWGDSEVGILSADQYNGGWENWHLTLAPFVPKLAPQYTRAWTPSIAGYIVAQSALFYANSTWAAYCSDFDLVEDSYYKLGGGKGDWTTLMREQFKEVHGNASNVASYIAPGGAHCVSDNSAFWDVKSNDVLLSDWIGDLLSGKPVQNAVDCSPNCL